MLKMVKDNEFIEPKKLNKNNSDNFTQRNYDYKNLETQLLGWD